MKKLLFFGALYVLILSSCGSRQTEQPLFEDYSLVGSKQANGMKYGVRKGGESLILTLYDTIVYDKVLDVFLCYNDGTIEPVEKTGKTVMYGSFTKVYKDGEWMRLEGNNGFYLIDMKHKNRHVGKITEYVVDDGFVFTSKDTLWGVVHQERFRRITDIDYQKVYIVNPHEVKNGSEITKDFAIFALKTNGKWKMYDPELAPYKMSSADIENIVKKAKPEKPCGVLKIAGLNW